MTVSNQKGGVCMETYNNNLYNNANLAANYNYATNAGYGANMMWDHGYTCPTMMPVYYPTPGIGREFTLIVVLFILLIIVGATIV